MSARLSSSRTSLLKVNPTRQQNALLLELLYLACALLLGALLAATSLAAPIERTQASRDRDERVRIQPAASRVVHLAPVIADAEFDSQ